MRLKGLALFAIVPVLLGAAVPAFAQTLADLAKQEEERRKKLPETAKVYTNKDLAPVPTSSTPPPPVTPSASSASSTTPASGSTSSTAADASAASSQDKQDKQDKKDEEKPNGPVKDKAYWAGKLKSLEENLSRDEGYAVAMQTRLNSLQTDFVNRDDPAQRAVIERDRNKVQAELQRLNKAIVDEKKAIADFMEEARRAGVPPGWLR